VREVLGDLRGAVTVKPWASDRTCEAARNDLSRPSFLVFDCARWSTCHLPIYGRLSLKVPLDETRSGVAPRLLRNNESPFPDLFLQVNFSGLAAFHPPPGTNNAIQRESLEVYSALTNITEDALGTTRPILLFPGMNLIGVVSPVIRKRFRAPALSAFGLFDVSPLK
jgi:hypothetical protein